MKLEEDRRIDEVTPGISGGHASQKELVLKLLSLEYRSLNEWSEVR